MIIFDDIKCNLIHKYCVMMICHSNNETNQQTTSKISSTKQKYSLYFEAKIHIIARLFARSAELNLE